MSAIPVTFSPELHLSVEHDSQFKLRSPSLSVVEEIQPIVEAMALHPIVAGGRHPLAMYSFPSLSKIEINKYCGMQIL